jgi:hypothetical protein
MIIPPTKETTIEHIVSYDTYGNNSHGDVEFDVNEEFGE